MFSPKPRKQKPWTMEEKLKLKKLGNGLSINEAKKVLPNRTEAAIKRMCNILAISYIS